MKKTDYYKTSIDPKHETIIPNLEIGKVIKKYESTQLKDIMDLNEYPKRNLYSHRYKETCLDRLDKIEHEILVYNDKLITSLKIEPIEFEDVPNYRLKTEMFNNSAADVYEDKPKALTPMNCKLSKKKVKGLLSKSVNVSPLRNSKHSTIDKQHSKTLKNDNNYNNNAKGNYIHRDYAKMKNISKFINKPKSSGKTTKATSRSSSVSKKNVSSNSVTKPSKHKRPLISFPSLNARNNDKIIVDLQTMFGKKVENFENMYSNLSETDKKNLISVLLSISFSFKNEIKEEKAKNDQLSKKLLNKTRQLNIMSKEIDSIKKIPNNQTTLQKFPQTPMNKKIIHGKGNNEYVLNGFGNILTDSNYKIASPLRKKNK